MRSSFVSRRSRSHGFWTEHGPQSGNLSHMHLHDLVKLKIDRPRSIHCHVCHFRVAQSATASQKVTTTPKDGSSDPRRRAPPNRTPPPPPPIITTQNQYLTEEIHSFSATSATQQQPSAKAPRPTKASKPLSKTTYTP